MMGISFGEIDIKVLLEDILLCCVGDFIYYGFGIQWGLINAVGIASMGFNGEKRSIYLFVYLLVGLLKFVLIILYIFGVL